MRKLVEYRPCGTCPVTRVNGPSVAFAYVNVACLLIGPLLLTSNDPIKSSPVLSFDGTKVAWVTSTGKVQVLTIGTRGTNGSLAPPTCIGAGSILGGNNNGALASVTLSGGPVVSNSAVYVDCFNDIAYRDSLLHSMNPLRESSFSYSTSL